MLLNCFILISIVLYSKAISVPEAELENDELEILRDPRSIFFKAWRLPGIAIKKCVAYERLCCPIKCITPPNNYCANPPGANQLYCAATQINGQGVATGTLCRDTRSCDACAASIMSFTCATAPECATLMPTTTPGQTPVMAATCPQFIPNMF